MIASIAGGASAIIAWASRADALRAARAAEAARKATDLLAQESLAAMREANEISRAHTEGTVGAAAHRAREDVAQHLAEFWDEAMADPESVLVFTEGLQLSLRRVWAAARSLYSDDDHESLKRLIGILLCMRADLMQPSNGMYQTALVMRAEWGRGMIHNWPRNRDRVVESYSKGFELDDILRWGQHAYDLRWPYPGPDSVGFV